MSIGGVILVAGVSRRFAAAGGLEATKLIAPLAGVPLARRVAETALASKARPVVAVTGYAREAVETALDGLRLVLVHNANFASGLASSLRTGLAALPADVDGAIILLGDMPGVTPGLIDRLIDRFDAAPAALAVAPVAGGRRGNPVLLSRALFAAAMKLEGDEGARRALDRLPAGKLLEVPASEVEAGLDVDTPAALVAAHRAIQQR